VEIALSNAAAALRASGVVPAGGPFEDDRDLAAWFSKLLDDDIAYLDASFEAARRAVDAAGDALRSPTLTRGLDVAPTFGIITAMPVELAAMRALLDDPRREPVPGDRAHYAVGSLPSASTDRPHQVVLTMLADTGTNAASEACANLARSFDAVSCVIMSGVAAGVPDPARPKRHVRLGDVVVSSWGVVDYDHVVDLPAGRSLRQQHPLPSPLLSRCVKALEAEEFIANGEAERGWERWITAGQSALVGYARPDDRTGRLFATDGAKRAVPHPRRRLSGHRPGRPKVHQGRIGSGDRSLRNVVSRDELAAEHDLIAFEMEATGVAKAGFSNGLEWIVVRSISDYGDMRTNDIWRPYAALVAAAYVRALLAMCEPIGVRGGLTGA
jgi:nucleoside phosphorylase